MLTKKAAGAVRPQHLSSALRALATPSLDRRTFLKRSGLAAGGLAAATALPLGLVRRAEAAPVAATDVKSVKSVCTHCSVGCTVIATVENGVWTRQEPG